MAILAPKHEDVYEITNQILDMLPGVATEYKSINTVLDANEVVSCPQEFLNSLDLAGLPPHRLLINVGSPNIILRNLDLPKLCRGTRLYVKKMLGNVIETTVLRGNGEGETVFIPWISLIPIALPFIFNLSAWFAVWCTRAFNYPICGLLYTVRKAVSLVSEGHIY
jgi:hypothetical protein